MVDLALDGLPLVELLVEITLVAVVAVLVQ